MPLTSYSVDENGVALLRLEREKARNAINTEMLEEVLVHLSAAKEDETVHVLVISSNDHLGLSAGADVREELDAEARVHRMELFARLYDELTSFPKPTVAACHGSVVGAGAEIAVACDLRVGGSNLRMRFPGAELGVPVGPARLAPLVGEALAKDLIFTSRVLGAAEAERVGFVRSVHPAEGAEAAALALAEELATRPVAGLRRMKRLFLELGDGPARVEHENEELVDFQRHGTGLPRRG